MGALEVSNVNDLRFFRHHSCIIFDDTVFDGANETQQQWLNLVDCTKPTTIKILYTTVTIPQTTRIIFVSNNSPEELFRKFSEEQRQSIISRCTFLYVRDPVYKDESIYYEERRVRHAILGHGVTDNVSKINFN